MTEKTDFDIEAIISSEEAYLKKLVNSVTSHIKEETLQNEQTTLFKVNNERQSRQKSKCKIEYLKKLKTQNKQTEDSQNKFIKNIKNIDSTASRFWQLLNNVEKLESSALTLLTDQNPFMDGEDVFSLLSGIYQLYKEKNIIKVLEYESSDKENQKQADPLVEIDEAIQQLMEESNKEKVFFLNLEYLTPEKILFVARLQKEVKTQRIQKLIIYADDILSEQLKESISPTLEIVFEKHSMPQNVSYLQKEVSSTDKPKMIYQICQDAITKYKQSLMRFDFVIFVKNSEEASKLIEFNLSLIQEKLNFIDLTSLNTEKKQKPRNFKPQKLNVENPSAQPLQETKNQDDKEKQQEEIPVLEDKINEVEDQIEIKIENQPPQALLHVQQEIVRDEEINLLPDLLLPPPEQENHQPEVPLPLPPQQEAPQPLPLPPVLEVPQHISIPLVLEELEVKEPISEYKKNEFNFFIAKCYKQLKDYNLTNVLIQIDTGETQKVHYLDSKIENIPSVSLKITKEEAIKRERLMGSQKSGEIHRLFSRKEYIRLQKRDSLNLINLEAQKEYKEIISDTNQQKQAIRILLHVIMNSSQNWFSCSSETGVHGSLLWSRMGDVHSIFNCIKSCEKESAGKQAKKDTKIWKLLEKNQICPKQYNQIIYEIVDFSLSLGLNFNPLEQLYNLEASSFSEMIQQVAIEKYYSNLCIYTGHRRHGFRHFESGLNINYSDLSSMKLIQERPFLLLPIQLSLNVKNQHEIKQCIAIDHSFLLESAPTAFVNKHKLRLLKRQSLNLHEIEYFGISNSLFSYFEKHANLIQSIENEFDCYYEPNIHMDTITIHCDSMHKEKIEKKFKELMETAQKELVEEIVDFPHGKNSIIRIEKGGLVKEINILENEHVFIIEGLPTDAKEKEIVDLCSEYGEILNVIFTEGKQQDTLQAEILVSDSEDGAFFVEMFDKTDFRGHLITARLKGHSYKIHEQDQYTFYNIFRWQTWKSKQTAKIEFLNDQGVEDFLKVLEKKLAIDGKEVQGTLEKENSKIVLLKNLQKFTDEISIQKSLTEELQQKIKHIQVERISDVDRGVSTASLTFLLKKIYSIDKINIVWIKRREEGFVEAKVANNEIHQVNQALQFNGKPGLLGQGKVYVKHCYINHFTYDLKMKEILHILLSGNQDLIDMQKSGDIKLKFKVVRSMASKEEYLMKLKCYDQDVYYTAKDMIKVLLTPIKIELANAHDQYPDAFGEKEGEAKVDLSQIFTEIGLKRLKEIEKKFPSYSEINLFKQIIHFYCTQSTFNLIIKEIASFLRSSIRIKIPVCGKNIRNILGFDGKGLEQLKGKFEVCKIQLDCVSKDVYMEGNSKQIEQAKNALLALLEEKNSQSFLNNSPYSTEDCMVCSEEIVTGYRLQGCGHKFCYSCVMFIIENSLGDLNSLPIKCPFCSKHFVLQDILTLMSSEQKDKMLRMSLNNYVQNHFQEVNFCADEKCRSIHSSKLSKYTCYECKKTYCAKCSVEYHFGLTCSVYQETEAKNIEYLLKEGARKCPKCGVYIIRYDGCYRVECRRCSCHICWKDNCMKYYDNSSDCYNHLDEMHGGYW